MRRQSRVRSKRAAPPPLSPAPSDLGLSVMITLYPDIVIAELRATINCRAGRGHGPRGWRAAGKIPVR